MKKVALILIFVSVTAYAQKEERDTIFTHTEEVDTIFLYVPTPVFSIGILGGATFINPKEINDQIEFNNSIFDDTQKPIRTLTQWSVWFTFRPKNMPSFFSIRGEYISTSRSYSYIGTVTDNSGNIVQSFNGTTTTRYTVYPFSINTGGVIPKTRVKAEFGFIYAFASVTTNNNMGSFGSSENSYDSDGYGGRLMIQQVIPIDRAFGITIELGYRYLSLDGFRDSKGRLLSKFEADYTGVTLMAGLSYGF